MKMKRIIFVLVCMMITVLVTSCAMTYGHEHIGYEITTNPTLDEVGSATAKCTCGEDEIIVIPALNDATVWTLKSSTAPTCTETGAILYESFYQTDGTGIVKIPNVNTEKNYGGHCMLIIGWTTINNKEYYVVQNSWGEGFGDNGFCYIPVDSSFPICEKWSVLDIQNYNIELKDIKGRWSENYINQCVRSGLISGYEDGTFKPTNSITREEVCALFAKFIEKFEK